MSNSLSQSYVASGWQYSCSVENLNEYLLKAGCMTNTFDAAEKSGISLSAFPGMYSIKF